MAVNNASLVSLVVEQLITDNLVVVKTNGKLTKHSAQTLGAAATSLALVMKKDRRDMFRHMRTLSLQGWPSKREADLLGLRR